jgi:flavin-dependent dehydrogenase
MWEEWRRPGVPQFRHLHAALARGRVILRERAPDVLEQILADGVEEFDVSQNVPGGVREPGDEELVILRFRRPIFEGALRRAVEREPRVRVLPGVAVRALIAVNGHPSGVPRVVGVQARDGQALPADLVVVAAGRRASVTRWLSEAGAQPPSEEWEDAGMVYYGRYYRLRAGAEIPTGQRPPVRGDLGYLSYVVGMADDRTFVLTWLAPAGSGPAYAARSVGVHGRGAQRGDARAVDRDGARRADPPRRGHGAAAQRAAALRRRR